MVVKILPSLNTARLVRNFLTYSQLQITFIKGSPLEYYDESPKDIVILIINICYGYSLTMYRRRPTKCVKGSYDVSTRCVIRPYDTGSNTGPFTWDIREMLFPDLLECKGLGLSRPNYWPLIKQAIIPVQQLRSRLYTV